MLSDTSIIQLCFTWGANTGSQSELEFGQKIASRCMVGALLEDEVRKTCRESSVSDKNRHKNLDGRCSAGFVWSSPELTLRYCFLDLARFRSGYSGLKTHWHGCAH